MINLQENEMKQQKLNKPYEGDDIAEWVKQNKSYSTTTHAFKDAKYAEWLEKDAEMSDMKLFTFEFMFIAVPIIILTIVVVVCVFKAASVF